MNTIPPGEYFLCRHCDHGWRAHQVGVANLRGAQHPVDPVMLCTNCGRSEIVENEIDRVDQLIREEQS